MLDDHPTRLDREDAELGAGFGAGGLITARLARPTRDNVTFPDSLPVDDRRRLTAGAGAHHGALEANLAGRLQVTVSLL